MTILYPAPVAVKPARPFGKGILASRPTYRAPFTSADLAWLAADDGRRRENAHFDALADAARGAELMGKGVRPF